MDEEHSYQVDFKATCNGWGCVTARNPEEAEEKFLAGDYDDIMDFTDYEIKEITRVELDD